jgi:hypothetical protein
VLTVPRPLPRCSHARLLTTTLGFRSIVADGGRSQLVAAFASAHVDLALVQHILVCTLVALLMACLLEKRDAHLAAISQPVISQPTQPTAEPTRQPLGPQDEPMDIESQPMSALTQTPTPLQSQRDESMDVDAAPPCSHSLLLSSALRALPFPGKLVEGVHEVEELNL